PDPLAEGAERCRKVDGQRGLADPALAARDGDHARGAIERDALGALGNAAPELGGQRRLLLGRHDVEVERDTLYAGDRRERLGDLLLEARAQGTALYGQSDRHGDVAAVDPNGANHVELGDRAAKLRVDDLLQRLEDLVARGLHTNEPSNVSAARRRSPSAP